MGYNSVIRLKLRVILFNQIKLKLQTFKKMIWYETLLIVLCIMGLKPILLTLDYHGYSLILSKNITLESMIQYSNIVASSMATIASIVFSLTVVSLMNIASNLSNRYIVKIFNDRQFRIILGLFVATFLYACHFLLILQQDLPFLPHNALTFEVILLLACIVALLLHFRYILASIQVDTICKSNVKDIFAKLDINLNPVSEPDRSKNVKTKTITANHEKNVLCHKSGYINFIDFQGLFEIACEHNLFIDVKKIDNTFVLDKTRLCTVASSQPIQNDVIDEICDKFHVQLEKINSESIDYKMTYLTDIVMKTLSPGINDTNSALVVVDHVSDIFVRIFEMPFPKSQFHDQNGYLRLQIKPFSLEAFMKKNIHIIVTASNDNPLFLTHMVNNLAKLAAVSEDKQQKKLLKELLKLVSSYADRFSFDHENDKNYEKALNRFKENLPKEVKD